MRILNSTSKYIFGSKNLKIYIFKNYTIYSKTVIYISLLFEPGYHYGGLAGWTRRLGKLLISIEIHLAVYPIYIHHCAQPKLLFYLALIFETWLTLPFHLLHIFLLFSRQQSCPALQWAQFLFHHIAPGVPE